MTVDFTYAVIKPEIPVVMDMETGRELTLEEALGNDYAKIEILRMELAEKLAKDQPQLYVCPVCGVKVYLSCIRSGNEKRFFFKHQIEDGSCSAITRGLLTKEEIDARRYNGAKESRAHIRIKEIIKASLECDPDFSCVEVESVWKGRNRAEWRKPDVRAVWRGHLKVVFEIQLSTTYLHVIAQRRQFYLREGGLLCWIFRCFDPSEGALLTQDDIFYNNNQNLFLASEETLRESKQRCAITLDCNWIEAAAGELNASRWQRKLATFSELTLDQEKQRVFFYDHDAQFAKLNYPASDENLRERFENWWTGRTNYDPYHEKEWADFYTEFDKKGIVLPKQPYQTDGPKVLINALYTAKYGKPIGWEHKKFISVCHTIAGGHPEILKSFRVALWVYGRAEQIQKEDAEGKKPGAWKDKVKHYMKQIQARDSNYDHDPCFDGLIAFLFPEIWRGMNASSTFKTYRVGRQ